MGHRTAGELQALGTSGQQGVEQSLRSAKLHLAMIGLQRQGLVPKQAHFQLHQTGIRGSVEVFSYTIPMLRLSQVTVA